MRDCNIVNNVDDKKPDHGTKTVYKEVVIVGNGPSGITLSYLLSGHSPFYNRKAHPDPMLSARLIECTQKSLLHQDLHFLSQGLEGRSKNPVSVLIDAMNHPGADMGLEWPSLLTWRKGNRSVEHVVLGRGQPGGTWQGIADNVLTISPGRWMSLPGMEFSECKEGRAPASAVAKYYSEYVNKHGLDCNMVSNTTVTMILPIIPPGKRKARWRVFVVDSDGNSRGYECRHLVLATGASDRAGCLGVSGESNSYVTHDLKRFEEMLKQTDQPTKLSQSVDNLRVLASRDNLIEAAQHTRHSYMPRKRSKSSADDVVNRRLSLSDVRSNVSVLRHSMSELNVDFDKQHRTNNNLPVLVVGAGLSASDAIIMARRLGYHVIHAFRSTPASPTLLPAMMYPEYHEIAQLMQGKLTTSDYTPCPGYQVSEFYQDNTVQLKHLDGRKQIIKISIAAILIGSQPDLSFLPKKLRNIGLDPNKPVDCKANPIYIDPFSYKCVRSHPGLYALGPLVGDNFVRFLQGGAVAVASHIFKESCLNNTPESFNNQNV